MLPELTQRIESGRLLPVLVWRLRPAMLAVSTGPLGGGIGVRDWLLNMTVPSSYARMDPELHLAEVARGLGLAGAGAGLMTAVNVDRRVSAADGGVTATATVGMRHPVWAAAPAAAAPASASAAATEGEAGGTSGGAMGTVNIVVTVPGRLGEAALVNAVATVVEARAQAMWELGLCGTGTPSDAVCVLCRADGEVWAYGGTRSHWGSRIARAVHRAVLAGGIADGLGPAPTG